jgi:hypothetical protein
MHMRSSARVEYVMEGVMGHEAHSFGVRRAEDKLSSVQDTVLLLDAATAEELGPRDISTPPL